MMWDIDQMKPLSATVVLSLFTPSFRRSTVSSGRTIKYLRYGFKRGLKADDNLQKVISKPPNADANKLIRRSS